MSADFLTLSQDPKAALGTSYVKHHTKQVKPGESAALPPIELERETAYVGVAVGFSAIDNVTWRAVERVNPSGESYNILVPIRQGKVAIQIHR